MLPAAYRAHLEAARSAYLAHFRQVMTEAAATGARNVVIEAAIDLDGVPADNKFDIIVQSEDDFERVFVVAPSVSHWETSEHELGGGVALRTDEIVWFAFTVYARPALPSLEPVQTWFRKWLQQGASVEAPFGGFVHFLDVTEIEGGHRIDVDLGSAPVAAVEELLKLCIEHGARSLWCFSGDDALAAERPEDLDDEDSDDDDDDDDDDMLELPDDLLEHLAEVRDDYLRCYIDRLRAAEGRIAIEAGAGQRQGELAMRVDFLTVDDAGTPTPHEVAPEGALAWEDGIYESEGLELRVLGLVWSSVMVMASPAPDDLSFLTAWYRRWIEEGFDVGEPFGGYVHVMSPPRRDGDMVSILVDFGTAPVEAMRDLIERCTRSGATTVTIGSGELALGSTPP